MKIGILDADLMDHGTRHPNLALMKIAGYYKEQGHEVKLIYTSYNEVYDFDEVYISKVFTFSNIPQWILQSPNVHIGGTGFFADGGANLPDEIEHHMPDYNLYKAYVEKEIENGRKRSVFADYLDYSIGFTTRGCFRKCAFCVNKKYDRVHRHSSVNEFYDSSKPYIYLWDDNILAYPQWEEVLDELEATGKPFQFRQGIDLRLMTDRKAYRFNNTHYHGDFIFAFDHLKDKELITERVQLWKRYSSRVCKMYVLSGFDSQDEKDIESVFERISVLMKYGSLPYIMRYEEYKNSRFKGMYIELARWCNQPQFFKKKSFREFCIANQDYKKNKESNCAAYQSMLDFEQEFPEIAKKYFDLRFDQENIYMKQYGYGRRYANKPLCSQCKRSGRCWTQLINGTAEDHKKLIKLYYEKEIDLQCLTYANSECEDLNDIVKRFVEILLSYDLKDIIAIICSSDNLEKISKDNIPQYSSIQDAIFELNHILYKANKELTYEEIGSVLEENKSEDEANLIALKKYGENHSKLATLIDLAVIGKKGNRSKVEISILGQVFYTLDSTMQNLLVKRLLLRIPIVQNAFKEGDIKQIDRDLDILSITTKKRRRSNVINVIRSIVDTDKILAELLNLEGE